jgi:hypothetical protein
MPIPCDAVSLAGRAVSGRGEGAVLRIMFLYRAGLKRHQARTGFNQPNAKSANNSRTYKRVALFGWRHELLRHGHGLVGPELGRLDPPSFDISPEHPPTRSHWILKGVLSGANLPCTSCRVLVSGGRGSPTYPTLAAHHDMLIHHAMRE